MFAWKCLKGIVPVGERLLARHINVDPTCKRCRSSESINHLLFHCPFTRAVWKSSPLDESIEVNGLTDLRSDWNYIHGQKCLPPTGLTKSPLVPWIMWSLWKGRNKLKFENHAGSPVETLTQAIISATKWENAHEQEERGHHVRYQEPLLQVATVVRSDAAWLGSNLNAGLSWIVMNAEQRTIGKRRTSFTASVLIAEGMALREAILECRARCLKEVRFESDSVQLIRAINLRSPNLEIYGIAEDTILLSAYFDVVVFVWIPRERNCETDGIVKRALALYEQEVGEAELLSPPN
ncbi:hypothetical protein Bca101_046719 [Brassica carinata]